MQELTILKKLKNIENYNNPRNAVVMGIVYSQSGATSIIKELYEMLEDNFLKTESILGEEITNLVLSHNVIIKK